MVSSRTLGDSPFARKPSANSRPSGFSMAAEMMRMGTSRSGTLFSRDLCSCLGAQKMVGNCQLDGVLPEKLKATFA